MSAAPAQPAVPPHDRIFGRLNRLAVAAMVPWMLLSFVSIMAFNSPNAIITPLMWAILICVWGYPGLLMLGRGAAWVLRTYGQYDRANLLMSLPGSLGAFLFAMLFAPLAMLPLFNDSYFALMASCLLSMVLASWIIGRLKRV